MPQYITCSGSYSEIGANHGRGAQEQIRLSIKNYRSLFASLTPPISWSEARLIATNFIPALEQHVPVALEEIRAIASAADVPFEDVLVLNCRSEIGLTGGSVDGCSALAYKNPNTGKQLLAQNWDWYGNQLENVIVLDVTLLDGTRLVTITEAGIVGKVGFNGDCVGVTLNAIKTAGLPLDYSKLPIHLAIRYIVLESPNAAEAINRLMRIRVASTVHFLIADAVSAYGIEVSPRGSGIITPDSEGFVLHTNHWISSPALVESVIWLVDTDARLKRLETLKLTINSAEDIWDVLADEEGWPGSICRGVSIGREAEMDLETLFGVVMDLEFGMAEMVHGRPKTGSPKVPLPRSGPLGNVGADVKRQSSG